MRLGPSGPIQDFRPGLSNLRVVVRLLQEMAKREITN